MLDGEDEEYDDDEEGEYEDEEYEDEFVEEGDEYVGGPDLGAGAYNQNIMDGIQAKSYTEQPRRQRSKRRRKRRSRNQEGAGDGGRTMGDEEEEYDDDYDNEGKAIDLGLRRGFAIWIFIIFEFWAPRVSLTPPDRR